MVGGVWVENVDGAGQHGIITRFQDASSVLTLYS